MSLSGGVYLRVLKELKVQRAELDAAITALSHLLAKQGVQKPRKLPGSLPPGKGKAFSRNQKVNTLFSDLTIPAAIHRYLELKSTPQTTSQIQEALVKGGLKSKAKDLKPNLYQVMLRKPTVFVRMGPGLWALAEWEGGAPEVNRASSLPYK